MHRRTLPGGQMMNQSFKLTVGSEHRQFRHIDTQ